MRIRAVAVLLVFVTPAFAAGMPNPVGKCITTKVLRVETRLMDGSTGQPMPGSGSAIEFGNGGYQVGYDQLPAVDGSRPGDPVKICLVSVPHGCPAGDKRGRTYRTTNLRTHGAWTLSDSEHSCGGA
jgi:hypothetical protein